MAPPTIKFMVTCDVCGFSRDTEAMSAGHAAALMRQVHEPSHAHGLEVMRLTPEEADTVTKRNNWVYNVPPREK